MIATKEGNTLDFPDNIPDLMLVYLHKLNCDRPDTEPDNPTSKEMLKL
ncbi:hypothetical protein [Nostoc sp.]